MIGNTLGRYEITALLGKGGMGEVYRATDTSLNREVAVKVLPSVFSHDPERVARFEREATTLAKLQHTNIATIYGFEQHEETRFLVMELVEGEDLSERLERGAISVEEAMLMAVQIAEGLEVAHNMGIVHRDLKPANLKLAPNGDVKILDFGLARAFAEEPDVESTIEVGTTPTMTAGMTQAGVILGTAAYMSPEQARGKHIDKQADVWSFGVVFYEMLTADRLFGGETISDSIGAVLHRDPDLTQLPDVPAQLHTLLRRCLARNKKQRLHDIGDARLEIEDAIAARGTATKTEGKKRQYAPWAAVAVLAVIASVAGWMALTRGPEAVHQLASLGLPREEAIDLGIHNAWPRLAFSPDGKQVSYIGGEDDNLYRRSVDSFDSEALAGVENVEIFTYSPDGLWVAYMADFKLWKIALSGGAPIELCATGSGPGLAWGNGHIYFSRQNGGGLWSVSEDGGEPSSISALDPAREETSHRWPHVLPGGRHLLITVKTARIATFDDANIGLLSLETGQVEVLIHGGTYPKYLNTGHIVYGRAEQLFAVPFDLASLTVNGTPTPVLDEIDTVDVNGCTQYALSANGDLAYLTAGEDQAELELTWMHFSGKTSVLDIGNPYSFQLAFSPDGKQLAAMTPAANDKIHITDFQRRITTRLTSTPGNDTRPIWSPDGKWIAYLNDLGGSSDIFLIPSDGSEPARCILASPEDEFLDTWSPDGKAILFTRTKADGRFEICTMPSDGNGEVQILFPSDQSSGEANISPDGRWITYSGGTPGDLNIYARRYDSPGRPTRISVAGGRFPQWSLDGKTIYYVDDKRVVAVPVETDSALSVGTPSLVVELENALFGPVPLATDGERFLFVRADPQLRKHFGIRVMFDWAGKMAAGQP